MTYAKQTWADDESGETPISAERLNHMEDGLDAAATQALTEALVIHDGTIGGGVRPTGYARVRWLGGTARPENALPGDLWEHLV